MTWHDLISAEIEKMDFSVDGFDYGLVKAGQW
jgi:hypothetical protein